jgi:Uma2 family endonuclease
MAVLAESRMTVDEFLAWARERPGRYELFRGEVFEMSPESIGHIKIKGAVYAALFAAVRRSGRPCHVLADGATVRIDPTTAYEPDALVYCGPEHALSDIEVPDPVILVEVLSPSTRQLDASVKLSGYFRLPSVAHYLIVDPAEPMIVHHSRKPGDDIVTRVVTDGVIRLEPLGLEIALTDIYSA